MRIVPGDGVSLPIGRSPRPEAFSQAPANRKNEDNIDSRRSTLIGVTTLKGSGYSEWWK